MPHLRTTIRFNRLERRWQTQAIVMNAPEQDSRRIVEFTVNQQMETSAPVDAPLAVA